MPFAALLVAGATSIAPQAVPAIPQSAVLDAPSPTTSVTWGSVAAFAGSDIVVTGPDRPKEAGFTGQLATFLPGAEGWKPLQEMFGIPSARPGDLYFQRIAASQNWVLTNTDRFGQVGAGAVLAIKRDPASASGWTLAQRLSPPPGVTAPNFGSSLVSDGVYAAIGVTDQVVRGATQRTPTTDPAVCLFAASPQGWQPVGILRRGAESGALWFGASLALDSGTLAVGSPAAIPPSPRQPLQQAGTSAVIVYRFVSGQWTKEAELAPPADCTWPTFGYGIALRGDTLLVRAASVDSPDARVFAYRRSGAAWAYDGEIVPSLEVVRTIGWGLGLAVGDGFVVVGDSGGGIGQAGGGAVCVFARDPTGWSQRYVLRPTVPTATNRFGSTLATRGRTILVGRTASERDGVQPGGVLLFELPAP